MHPATSLIAFTTLTGAGFGLIAALGLGLAREDNSWEPWLATLLALGLTLGGLAASTKHLGNPQRALLAFREWRTSWLSREAVLAAATLVLFAVHMALWLLFDARLWLVGIATAALALATIYATSKIYHQLRTVPRWSRPPTPLLFLALGGSSGLLALSAVEALLGYPPSLTVWKAAIALIAAGLAAQLWGAQAAEATRAADGSTPETATGLAGYGTVRQLDPPHTSPNWLLKEMVFETGRRRAEALRLVALGLGLALPIALAIVTDFWGGRLWLPLAFLSHLAGVAAHRWLFFAEAEHVVGLYYGKR